MLYFIVGLFWGSFLNNVAYRLVKREGFVFNRSKCPHCGKILVWYELIPIISFIIQRGRCRNCGNKISLRYPLAELITGLFTYGIAQKTFLLYNLSPENFLGFLFLFFLYSIIFILALYDLDTFYISETVLYLGFIGWLLFIAVFYLTKFPEINLLGGINYLISIPNTNKQDQIFKIFDLLFGAFIFSFIFLMIFLVTLGKGMGLGDVKVAFLVGLFLKLGDLFAILLIASLIGSLVGFFIILFKKTLFKEVPFIPFLFSSLLIALLLGDFIYQIFINFMLKLTL